MTERKLTVEEIKDILAVNLHAEQWESLDRLCHTALAALEEAKAYAAGVEVLREACVETYYKGWHCKICGDFTENEEIQPFEHREIGFTEIMCPLARSPGEAGAKIVEDAEKWRRTMELVGPDDGVQDPGDLTPEGIARAVDDAQAEAALRDEQKKGGDVG